VRGFRLGVQLAEPPRLMAAALRPGMLQLAGRESDGAILNWLSADDVKRVAPIVKAFGADKDIVARIFVAPDADAERVRHTARLACAAYLTVPVYAAYQEWLGRGPRLAPLQAAWRAGDRKGALAAIPDDLVDELVIHGPPEACREQIARYVENGVDTPVLMLMGGGDPVTAMRALAPR
jgi:alkanesulfonate monooxygenase SsuD/methylene tetrahydromethanopterin reductase-like flavin-dependent oxidoreductase (luciferase family)